MPPAVRGHNLIDCRIRVSLGVRQEGLTPSPPKLPDPWHTYVDIKSEREVQQRSARAPEESAKGKVHGASTVPDGAPLLTQTAVPQKTHFTARGGIVAGS